MMYNHSEIRAEGFSNGCKGEANIVVGAIDSNVAELICAKLSGIVEDICQNNLAKEFVGNIQR